MKRDPLASPARGMRAGGKPGPLVNAENGVSSASQGKDAREDMMKEARTEATKGNGRAAAALPALSSVLEAVLFATDKPVTIEQLRYALPEAEPEAIERTLVEMEREHGNAGGRLSPLSPGRRISTSHRAGTPYLR
ncbi:MAG: hypothetical protein U0527_14240 [Candidatus Eisenbacteria bacterium]